MTNELKLFFDNFDKLAESPGGVQKLRELILQLAVQGKLVPQDPNDEPASELLKKIKAEKDKLIKEGKIKKQKPLPPIEPDEIPYKLAKSWEWTRFGECGLTQTGTTPSKSNPKFFGNDYPFVKPGDIFNKHVNYDNEGLSKLGIANGRLIKAGSALMVCIGGSIGKVGYIEKDCSCNQQINAITPYSGMNNRLFAFFMRSPYFQNEVLSRAPQTTLPILSKGKWDVIPLPLPPLTEQKRIVKKVDELMALCDELEAKQEKARHGRIVLNNSAIDHLFTAGTTKDFDRIWQIICENFDLLYNDPQNVDKLRQAILQLAVQGKLVKQNPNDEPALELLKKIKVEKEKFIKEGKIKKQKPLPTIEPDKIPYKSPLGWFWVRLPEIVHPIEYAIKRGPFGSSIRKDMFVPSGYKIYEQKNAIYNDFSLGSYYITKSKFEEMKPFEVKPNDIIISCSGTVGKLAVAPDNMEPGIINQALLKVNLNSNCITNEYFIIMFTAYLMQTETLSDLQGTAQKNITSVKILKNIPIPLPPFAEQKRIVKKVDELMALCDQLAEKIKQSQDKSEKLMAATIHHLLVA